MTELKPGTLVKLTVDHIKVIKELGRGGQGIVYLAEYKGNQYALKWYTQKYPDIFYNNLKFNVEQGAPSKAFLWPLMITKKQYDSFGYVMQLRPKGYHEFGDYLLAKANFTSFSAMITTALKICEGFHYLHLKGFSYQDLNDGNFFINPQSGDVLICDNDNVTAQGQNTGIMGKARYMAPEIVAGGKPDKYSDRFSLAVILFMLFYGNHPLEGNRVVSCPCMTEELERKHYGSEALFIYDKDNQQNAPIRGVHINAITRWPLFPADLRNAFTEAFSQAQIKNPTNRMLESKWGDIISSIRNQLIFCGNCGKETFVDFDKASNCIECRKPVKASFRIETNNHGNIALSPRKNIYLGKLHQPIASVQIKAADPSCLEIKNISSTPWLVETTKGTTRTVAPNDMMPVKPGLKITFSQGERGEIL